MNNINFVRLALVAIISLPTGNANDYEYRESSIIIDGSPFADDETSTAVEKVQDDQNRGELKIYPNPASDVIYIHINDQVTGTVTLRMTDLEGKTVLIRSIENNSELKLSETGLAAGIYIVTAEYQGVSGNSKLVYLPGK